MAVWAALAVFVLVYSLLIVPTLADRVRRRFEDAGHPIVARAARVVFSRPGLAVSGGVLMLVVGAVSIPRAVAAVDLGTLALLVGMMALVAVLDLAGLFDVLAAALVRRFTTPRGLLVATAVLTATLSAILLNDAVVLLFTPVLVRAARARGVALFPLLAVEAVSANVGSVATPVGNPQNAFIALKTGLSFIEFARALVPLALVSLALAVAFALVLFRRDLLVPKGAAPRHSSTGAPVEDRALFASGIALTGAVLVGFIVAPAYGAPLWAVALSGGLAAAILALVVSRVSPVQVARRINGGILSFFIGLFVLIEGLRATPLVPALDAVLAPDAGAGMGAIIVASAILSNLVSNVPAVLLLLPAIEGARSALALAAASTLAGNATVLGAAANVIVAESARANGESFDAGRFILYGLPVTVATLLVAWMLL